MSNTCFRWVITLTLAFSAMWSSAFAAGYTQTKYPIVLVHGLFGFDEIGGLEYFYKIPTALRSDGASVYVAQVSAANSTEVRGEQLLTYVKQVLAVSGAEKVNLIGHSHGGPTARYVASVSPKLVASVTTVGGVNKGTPIADIVVGVADKGTLAYDVIEKVGDGIAMMISALSGSPTLPQDAYAAYVSLSTAGSKKFNEAHPQGVPTSVCGEGEYQVNNVLYFSWGGGKAFTNQLDPVDYALSLTALAFGMKSSDGLVSSCSSHLGRVIRDDYAMNHFDEVNQTVGLVNINETDPVTLYRQHANRLQLLGL